MATTSDPRRFGGLARLYSEAGLTQLKNARVMVVGLGGVGSWAAEALARSGVGHLTLVDGDTVAMSNTNRQLHALEGNYGRYKAEALRDRLMLINPDLDLKIRTDFITKDNIETFFSEPLDWVLDCIDDLHGKTILVAKAHQKGVKIAVSGGASARRDPFRLRCADLARVKGDPLLSKLRTFLRKQHGFPRGNATLGRSSKFGIPAIYSDEPLYQPTAENCLAIGAEPDARIGFGSAVMVTGSVGLRLAAIVVNDILGVDDLCF